MSPRRWLSTVVATVTIALLTGCTSPLVGSDVMAENGWTVTVYYTAVESFHRGTRDQVHGCLTAECAHGDDALGRYPASFVQAVHDEGTGRITSGQHSGKYLNWSHNVGYWLDTVPRDAKGRPLEPFRSAAADGLADGTPVRLVDCGRLDSGEPVPERVCATLRAGQWEIRDQFTPGLGGADHIDLYIGEETSPHFSMSNELYVTLHNAVFAPRP